MKTAKKIKIFVITGVSIDLKNKDTLHNKLHCIVGYFTNLKRLYEGFERSETPSYSTICAHLKKKGYFFCENLQFDIDGSYIFFNEIIIRQCYFNTIYHINKRVSLSNMLSKEIGSLDFNLAMNLTTTSYSLRS